MAGTRDQGARDRAPWRRQRSRGHQRLLRAGLGAASILATTVGLSALPTAASADLCTVTVTVAGGAHLSFQLNLAPGTPLSSLSPPVQLPILGVTETCAPATPTNPAPSSSSTSTPTSTHTTTTRVPTTVTKAPAVSKRKPQKVTVSKTASGKRSVVVKPSSVAGAVAGATKHVVLRGSGGAPTTLNPTYSFALPGP